MYIHRHVYIDINNNPAVSRRLTKNLSGGVCVYMYICLYMYKDMYRYTCIYIYIYIYIHVHTYIDVYTCRHAYAGMYEADSWKWSAALPPS